MNNLKDNTLVVTLATRSFLPQVKVLADSLYQHHPECRLRCYLVEDQVDDTDRCSKNIEILPVSILDLPNPSHFFFQYTPFELCCALKPFCILHALESETKRVLYLDADMMVINPFLGSIQEVWNKGILVTPHLRNPAINTDYKYFLKSGYFNAGFLGALNNHASIEFLNWWRDRLAKDCYHDYYGGILDDQRWLDMAIALFDSTDCLRHPGINVAHWNIHECSFSSNDDTIYVSKDIPLCLFHFSSFCKHGLTKHQMVTNEIPDIINDLAADYSNKLQDAKSINPVGNRYSFDQCADGSCITPAMREAVRLGLVSSDTNPFMNPYAVRSTLSKDNPESIFKNRMDYQIAAQKQAALRIPELEKDLWTTRNRLNRIEQHPVIGQLLKLWARFINSSLD